MADTGSSVIAPEDLEGLPGAPFTQASIDAAVAAIVADCGWHIAPVKQSKVQVPGGSSLIMLPSLHVTDVVSVKDMESGRELTGFVWLEKGMIYLRGNAPRFVEVVFEHGFDEFPEDLRGVVAALASVVKQGGRITAESLSGHSISIDASEAASSVQDPILARYTVPGGVVSA